MLGQQLERLRDSAWRDFAKYHRSKRNYVFDEDIWKECDPYGFELYDKLRTALSR